MLSVLAVGSVLALVGLLAAGLVRDSAVSLLGKGFFLAALAGLIALALLRSAWATRLDGFTIDEPYHVTSGVSYARTGDFRLNPEHPPLTKLWVGTALPAASFRLPPFRPLADKPDERKFTNTAVFLDNDPDAVQTRARAAMLAFNGLLLFAFGLAACRALGPWIAGGAVGFLAIDPTVAAHAPVVMTDLPIALTAATAVLAAAVAFRSWALLDLATASLALGLALGTKHSGLIAALAVAALGAWQALAGRAGAPDRPSFRSTAPVGSSLGARTSLPRLAAVAAVGLGALLSLWSLHGLRFAESPEGLDRFNRPLGQKIEDLRTPLFRNALSALAAAHALPRSYLWGLADVLRTGVEGRGTGAFVFGRYYPEGAPWYFFPVAVAAKVPLGLSALALLGAGLLVGARFRGQRLPAERRIALAALGALATLFLAFLGSGSAYAGVRHALPVFPFLAVLAGVAVDAAACSPRRSLAGAVAVAGLAAVASAVPVVRPWEYFNELAGGTAGGPRFFADEGIDLGQRTRELARYYHRVLGPAGEVPLMDYPIAEEEVQARGMKAVLWTSDGGEGRGLTDTFTGAIVIDAGRLAPWPLFDLAALRAVEPAARFGNLLIYSGTFDIPWRRAMSLYMQGIEALTVEKDTAKGERMLREVMAIYPRCYVAAIEVGNLAAGRGDREDALAAFTLAREHSYSRTVAAALDRHLERLATEQPTEVPSFRNPWAE